MITVSGCACAVSAAAVDEEESSQKAIIHAGKYQNESVWIGNEYEVNVGDVIECVIIGTSTNGVTGFTGLDVSTYINQQSGFSSDVNSDIDMLAYSTDYYEGGSFYQAGSFPGALFMTRPDSEANFDRDEFECVVASGVNTGSFEPTQDIVRFTLEVKNPGECYINSRINEVVYMDGDTVTSNLEALDLSVSLNVVKSSVEPTDPSEEPTAPSEEPTAPSEEPTVPSEEPTAPSEEPSEEPTASTEAPTTASDPTEASTNAPTQAPIQNGTSATSATNATTSGTTNNSTNSTGGTSSTATGKVATGDSSAVALLLTILVVSAGAVVFTRKRLAK